MIQPSSSLRWVHRPWEAYGRQDPLWAVLADPAKRGGRWDVDEFLATGHETVDRLLARAAALGVELPDGPALDFGCGVGRLTTAWTSPSRWWPRPAASTVSRTGFTTT